MNKANSLHNSYKLGEFTARRTWYQLDSQGRGISWILKDVVSAGFSRTHPHETIIDKRIYVIPHRHNHGSSNTSLKETATLEPHIFTFAS